MPDEIPPREPNEPKEGKEQAPVSTTPLFAASERVQKINVADEIKNSFLDYSMSVIISRALPDVRDGLKPSQRRILYAMFEMGVMPGRKHVKCARIVGETMGKYHPHGDVVIYPTLVHMAQSWAMREMLVEGQGNFGSVEGDPPASMRYTEARLRHLGAHFDARHGSRTRLILSRTTTGTCTEPTVFPAAFPNLLVNGGTGIAVGMATNMAPHNLGEVIDGICAQIDNPEITVDELMKHVKGPDFPTGCMVMRRWRGSRTIFPPAGQPQNPRQGRRRSTQGRTRADHHHRNPLQRQPRHAGRAHRRTGQRESHHRHHRRAR